MKFKVWDIRKKQWFKEELYGTRFFIDSDGSFYREIHGEPNSSFRQISNDDYIPVFSTGKTDKNGVELFDGDIFKPDHYQEKYMLEMRDNFFVAVDLYHAGKIVPVSLFFDVYGDGESKVKKIGSKYENPELLEGVL